MNSHFGPQEIVEAFLEAANAHDIDKSLSYLDDRFVFREKGAATGMDKRSMSSLLAWDREIDSQASYEALEILEEEVHGIFSESNSLYRRLGIPKTDCRLTFRVREGRIQEQIIDYVMGDGPTFDDALEPFLSWADEYAPDEIEELQPEGVIVFTAEMAKSWLSLLDRWEADGAPGRIGG